MKVTEVRYTRKYNLGNYESEEIGATAVIDDGGDTNVVEAIAELKTMVESSHAGEDNAGEETETEETEETKPPKKPKKEKKPKKDKKDDDGEDGDDESDDADNNGDDADSDDGDSDADEDGDEAGEEEQEEEKPPKKSGKEKGGKKFRKKPQVYQRDNEAHKEIFSGLLKDVAPKWKASFESKELAKQVSKKMEGKEFLDEDGKVFPAFKDSVRKQMAGKKK